MAVLLHVHRVFHLIESTVTATQKKLTTKRKLASNFSDFKTQKKITKNFMRYRNTCRPLFVTAHVKKMRKKQLVDEKR